MNNFWLFAGFLALYFALQLWILPAFGISTWLSGKCSQSEDKDKADIKAEEETEGTDVKKKEVNDKEAQ